MILLKGTIQDGRVVLPHRANVPDGTDVTIVTHESGSSLGIPDHEWPTEPQAIARLVARMDAVEPFEFTPVEEGEMAAWRQAVKSHTPKSPGRAAEGIFE